MVAILLLGLAGLLYVQAPAADSAPPEAVRQAVLLDGLNPFLLTNLVSRRVVVEIDWVAGARPAPESLQAAETLLRRHCPAGKRIEVRLDDEIEWNRWIQAGGRRGLEELVASYLDHDPSRWDEAEVVYVLYVPDGRPWFGRDVSGITDRIVFEHSGETRTVRTVLLFTDSFRRDAWLWVTRLKYEKATFVHELGHVLGLVSNPLHVQKKYPQHCKRSRCVMHQPTEWSLWVNALPVFFTGRVPHELGRLCAEDIRAAKNLWSAHASSASDFSDRLQAARARRDASIIADWQTQRRLP